MARTGGIDSCVAGGVAGEFWYEEKIGAIDACTQQADNARAEILEKEAGDAKQSAKGAARAADAANESAGAAHQKSSNALTLASDARSETTVAQHQIRDLDATRQKLQTDFADLTKKVDWIRIPRHVFCFQGMPDHKKAGQAIKEDIKPRAVPVIIEYGIESEQRQLAIDIQYCFIQMAWPVTMRPNPDEIWQMAGVVLVTNERGTITESHATGESMALNNLSNAGIVAIELKKLLQIDLGSSPNDVAYDPDVGWQLGYQPADGAKPFPRKYKELPDNTVLILIGPKKLSLDEERAPKK